MSVGFLLSNDSGGGDISAEELWALFEPTYPQNVTRPQEQEIAFDFGYTAFSIEVAQDGRTAEIRIPLAYVKDAKALLKPAILALMLAQRFGWQCKNLQTGKELTVQDVFGKM